MWQPISISLKNLFSHKETIFHFKQNEMILLLGINKDGNGSNSNAAGKSTIIEAICLAVTSEVYRKVSKVEFIRRGQKDCIVIFTLQHSVTQQIFRIERQFFINSKSSTVRLFEQNKGQGENELTQMTNPNESNKYIFTKLGISKEDFLNYFVIGQGNPNSFFGMNDTGQKAVIARFSNYEKIDLVLNQLKIDVDELNEDLASQNSQLYSVQAIMVHLQEEIVEQKSKFEENKKVQLENKQAEIDELKIEITSSTGKIEVQEQKLIKGKAELKALNLKIISTETLKTKLAADKQSLAAKKQELKEIDITLNELNKQSGKAIECPNCNVVFIPNSDLSPEEVRGLIQEVETMRTGMENEIEEIESSIEEKREEINKQAEISSQIRIKNSEIISATDIKQNYQNQLENKNKKLKNLLAEFQAIKSIKPNNSILEVKSKLEAQKTIELNLLNEIKSIEEQIVEKQFYQYHFGKSGLKTFLANKSIKAIQDVTNYYLEKLETNLLVNISGYKVLKSGEVRDQIVTKVITDGIEESLFNAYSGGEKERIDACGSVAVNFMINNSCETGGLNLIIFDERSFLDQEGQRYLIDTLAKLHATSVLVLHHVDNIPYKNKMYIQKQNKVSSIVDYSEPTDLTNIQKLLQIQ